MFKIKIILTILAINSVLAMKALSQTQIVTISSILEAPVEGKEVRLQGRIIAQEPGETDYIFTDGHSKITIQLQKKDFPYNPDTTIEILGVIDFESQHIEEAAFDPTPEDIQINVSQLRVISLDN